MQDPKTMGRNLWIARPAATPLRSVRTLLLGLALACLLPGVIGAVLLFFQQYQDGRASLKKDTIQTARALTQSVDSRLLAVQNAAQALATSGALARQDLAAFHRRAQVFVQQTGVGTQVVVSDASGQQLVNTLYAYGASLPRHGDPAQLRHVFTTGQPLISGGWHTGSANLMLDVPVRVNGQVLYVMSVGLIPQQFADILRQQHLPPDWVAEVLDPSGTIVVRTRAPERFVGTQTIPELRQLQTPEGVVEADTRDGVASLIAFSRSAATQWRVAIAIPRESLAAQLWHNASLLGLGLFLLFGLGLGLAWIMGNRIARSVKALTVPATALEAGQAVVLPQVYFLEAEEVVQAMNRTAQLLLQRTRSLHESYAALQSSETELTQAQHIAHLGSWNWDVRTDAVWASEEALLIYGQAVCPLLGQQLHTLYPREGWQRLNTAGRVALKTGQGYSLKVPALRGDGSPIWLHIRGEVVRLADGDVVGISGTVQDITAQRLVDDELAQHRQHLEQLVVSRTIELSAALTASTQAKLLLRRSQQTLSQAARIALLGAWSIESPDLENLDRSAIVLSDEMYWLLDYSPQDVPHPDMQCYMARVHPDDLEHVKEAARQALAAQRAWQVEYRLLPRDGSVRWVLETGEFNFDAKGKVALMYGAVKDITAQRHVDQQLRHSDARLRLALEGAHAGIYEWNLETGAGIWTDDIWKLLGLELNSAPPCLATWRQNVHPADLARVDLVLQVAVARCADYEVEWRVNLPAGAAPRWLLDRARAVLDAPGRVLMYQGIVIDISARKQAEFELMQSRELLEERVVERTTELLAAEIDQKRLNRALRLLSDCNLALVRAGNEQQLLDDLCQLVVASDRYRMGWVGVAEQDAQKSIRTIAQAGPGQGALDHTRLSWDETQDIGRGPTGTALRTGRTQVTQIGADQPELAPWREMLLARGYQSIAVLPLVRDQQVMGVLKLASDELNAFGPDEIKLLEEMVSNVAYGLQALRDRSELTRYQQQLEALVAQRTQMIDTLNLELQERARDAEAANHAKSAFLATMSHELRTPLNAVVGLTGLLMNAPLGRRQRDYADKIKGAAQALRLLIDDVLDFSRIEAGELVLEQVPFSLNAILRTLAAAVGVGLSDKPIEALFDVAPDIPDALIGDALRLQQILLNLTGNAVKFTEAGEIVVAVRWLVQDAAQVTLQFTVRDTGIGIASNQLGLIFDRFTQADNSISRQYGGSGLGLTISARLANLMGGQIGVDSTLGQGSAFCFGVTLALDANKAPAAAPAPPSGLNILIIDDHALTRELLTQTCLGFGWQATALDSGAAGLAELQRSAAQGCDYDLLLLDWRMPGMDGLAMLRQAYQTPGIGLPLVILMATLFELELAVAASDDLYLDGITAKPLLPASLLSAVTRAYSGEFKGSLPHPGKTDHRLSGLRLLVAEDNDLNQEVIEQILTRAGAKVVLAANGLAAVAALRVPGAHFDAVLMDIQMPVMDGYTATRIIREELGLVDLPIIAVTAFARTEDREKSRRAGMVGHIAKPLDVEDLLDLVDRERQGLVRDPSASHAAATPPGPAVASPLAGLDVATGLETFGGNKKKYAELLHQFLTRHGDDAAQAHRLFKTGDTEGAGALLHGVTGVAGFLRAMEVARLAGATKEALKEGHLEELALLFDELQVALVNLQVSVDQFDASPLGA